MKCDNIKLCKINILVSIFNLKEQPEYIKDIEVVSKIKYLGIEIDNKKNYFKSQRNNIHIPLPNILCGSVG